MERLMIGVILVLSMINWLKKAHIQTHGETFTLGCTSQKVWLDYISAHQYYASVDEECLEKHTINRSFYTKSWDNAARVAMYKWTEPLVDANIEMKIGNNTGVF